MDNIQRNRKTTVLNEFFQKIVQHPFIAAAVVCILSMSLTTGEKPSVIASAVSAAVIFFLGVCASTYIALHDIKEKRNQKIASVLLIIGAAVIAFLFCIFVPESDAMPYILLNAGLIAVMGVFVYLGLTDRLTTEKIIMLIIAAGFLVRLVYVLYTPVTSRQHDVNSFGSETGHAAYIKYIYDNHHLPDFDVRTKWQFYHPPLHHTISAVWLSIQTFTGIDFEYACENIQILTLFYSSICMIISYKIFHQLGLKRGGLICACAVVAFCPTFFIMAGSINNDILSITFMLGAVLNTIYWYKNPTYKNILAIALCIGLGMMTKLSVWMVAPAVAFVFIYVFFKNLKNFKKYLLQFVSFAVVCIPLGLWWSVRNLIGFGVPLTYVPRLSESSDQYIGNIPLIERLFNFNFSQFTDVGDQFTCYGGSYNEFNPLVGLFKTSVFDEMITESNYPNIAILNDILFWSAVIVGVIGFISMAAVFVSKKGIPDIPMKIFLFLIYAVIFISYYTFCIGYPHVCTQNIRYAVPLIILGAYFTGLAVQNFKCGKIIKRCICVCVGAYSVSSVLVYDIVAMSSCGI